LVVQFSGTFELLERFGNKAVALDQSEDWALHAENCTPARRLTEAQVRCEDAGSAELTPAAQRALGSGSPVAAAAAAPARASPLAVPIPPAGMDESPLPSRMHEAMEAANLALLARMAPPARVLRGSITTRDEAASPGDAAQPLAPDWRVDGAARNTVPVGDAAEPMDVEMAEQRSSQPDWQALPEPAAAALGSGRVSGAPSADDAELLSLVGDLRGKDSGSSLANLLTATGLHELTDDSLAMPQAALFLSAPQCMSRRGAWLMIRFCQVSIMCRAWGLWRRRA
jgi:hypothetical protein